MTTKLMLNIISVAAIFTGVATGCAKTPEHKVDVTVEVVGDGVKYTGRSVQILGCRKGDPMWSGMDVGGCTVHGEAVVVDMGPHGYLFMPFAGANQHNWEGYAEPVLDARTTEGASEWDVAPEELLFVTFDDPAKSQTVRKVAPDDLGSGLKVARVHVTVSEAPVTEGVIAQVVPWVGSWDSATYLSGNTTANTVGLESALQVYDFKRDID